MSSFTLDLRPYEVDISVTWSSMPSRDDYLAAKVRAWSRDELDLNTVSLAVIQHVERPFVPPASSDVRTLAQRWSFFRELVASEMDWHGLLPQWKATYDHGRRRAGMCVHASKTLSFSRHMIARGSPVNMRNTLLHEIAHAVAGPRHGHDRTWRAIARQIGCDGQRCHTMELAPPTWLYGCSAGCWHVPRFKRSHLSASTHTCRMCGAACMFVHA